MIGKDRHNWSSIPDRRAHPESISHQPQFTKLDKYAALTIIRAPIGYGKSTLVASWLRTIRATERISVWIPEPAPSMTAREYWAHALQRFVSAGIVFPNPVIEQEQDPFTAIVRMLRDNSRPVILVLIRPDKVDGKLDESLADLVKYCRCVNLVVTLTGRTVFPEPHLLDLDQESISAHDLLYTLEDTTSVLEGSGAHIVPGEIEHIYSMTGGLPVLVRRSISVLKNLPTQVGREHLLRHNLRRVIQHYTQESIAAEAHLVGHYDLVVATEAARELTVDTVMHLLESCESSQHIRDRLIALEAAGVLSYVDTEVVETWRLAPAIRQSILTSQPSGGSDPAARLSYLSRAQLDAGQHASALDYAVEAQDWPLAVDILDKHWATMIADNLELVRSAFQQIPPESTDKHSSFRAARNLYLQHPDEQVTFGTSLPDSADELRELGASADAVSALTIGCIQALMLMHVGEYDRAADVTVRLIELSRYITETDRHDISDRLSTMRAQWAITFQLNGRLAESTGLARMAYWSGKSQRIDYIARSAAGTAALNWAVVGELRRARQWLDLENQHRNVEIKMQSQVKVAGLTAGALVSLDSLDFEDAERALTELGHPTENDALYADEFWAFTVYARSQFALSNSDAFSALSLLRRTVAAHSAQCNPTSIAEPLMLSTEMDLLLALGEGNKAASLAESIADPGSNPWTLVSVARVRQRMGQNKSAIILCNQYQWKGEPYPRAQMESLLVQAVAHSELGEDHRAIEAWSYACAIADQTGLLRPFSTIAAEDIEKLEAAAFTRSKALEKFTKVFTPESFPRSLHIVILTGGEQRVLALLALGMTTVSMSRQVHVSANTIKSQLRSLYKKLDAHNRDEALAKAHALQLL